MGSIGRLARDNKGNTLAIVAAALIPLAAMIGSGVDLSRAYMAQARLQLACDAAALAGRRAMKTGTVDATVRSEAQKFFNFNFKTGTKNVDGTAAFGAKGFTPVVAADKADATTVTVSAETTIPTAVMQIMGHTTLPIKASCKSRQDYVNTDVVLVLDTTGSMNDSVGGKKKIVALREAVLALYDELDPVQKRLEAAGLRLRYAVVPYSTTTNVGKLLYGTNNNNGYIRTSQYYQQCSTYDRRGNCTGYSPKLVSHNANWFKNTWNGCIEERKTTTSITGSSSLTIPNDAWDLRMDLIPDGNNDSKWGANDPSAQQSASTAANMRACPYEAERLKVWSRSDFTTYLPKLNTDGYTYHDTGMIWGTRMIARTGIWAGDNPTTYGGMPVNRHLIFMTDGTATFEDDAYTAYGVEKQDKRIAGGSGSELSRHLRRMEMICNYAKMHQDVSIWVVGFATTLNSSVSGCASNASQVMTAATAEELAAKFALIGKNIGALRLTQ